MDYLEWNKVISNHFFNEEMAGREVVLYVDNSLINKLGEYYGVNVEDFSEAVAEGPSNAYAKGICNKALWALTRSQDYWDRERYPLYIAYLAFFVLAVDTEGDFSDLAYYPRINSILGIYDERILPNSFKELDELWFDLEKWSTEIKKEGLGRFTTKSLGPWRHVGFPISQTLLTSEERERLPIFFSENGFDPSLSPDLITISKAIPESLVFRNRTRRLILNEDKEYKHLRDALLDLIKTSLEEWDGIVLHTLSNSSEQNGWINAGLRICIELDNFAMAAKFSIRFKSYCEFPDDEFEFIRQSDGVLWKSKASVQSWSRPLIGYYLKRTTDATILNWDKEEIFIDNALRWKVRLKPTSIRVFISGNYNGLNGWVETNKLEQGVECLIACHESYVESVTNWGMQSCEEFTNLDFLGIPSSWYLFKAKNVIRSHPDVEVLKLPLTYSIHFLGGIKAGRGNYYFRLAPPKVYIEGVSGREILKLNGKEIQRFTDNIWSLPGDIEENSLQKIELFGGESFIMSRFLTFQESTINPINSSIFRDKFGNITTQQQSFVVSGINVKRVNYNDIPKYISYPPTHMSQKIIFIGKHPGLYCEWPNSKIPNDWSVVWAIAKIGRDKWKAYFVGNNIMQCTIDKPNKSIIHWKKWKKILTSHNVEPPSIRKINDLWKSYKREAQKL